MPEKPGKIPVMVLSTIKGDAYIKDDFYVAGTSSLSMNISTVPMLYYIYLFIYIYIYIYIHIYIYIYIIHINSYIHTFV